MNYFIGPLGRSGLQVSPLCLGSENFVNSTPEKIPIEIVHSAVGNGINLIDTANVYASGRSEEIIDQFSQNSDCRNNVILTTKYYYATGNEGINDRGGLPESTLSKPVGRIAVRGECYPYRFVITT